jgi:hypothetical protein
MFRVMVACLLVAGATTGCAHLQGSPGYCLVVSKGSCSELEGNGDCQPCPSAAPR